MDEMINGNKMKFAKKLEKDLMKKFADEMCIIMDMKEPFTCGNTIESKGEFYDRYCLYRKEYLDTLEERQRWQYDTKNFCGNTAKLVRPGLITLGRFVREYVGALNVEYKEAKNANAYTHRPIMTRHCFEQNLEYRKNINDEKSRVSKHNNIIFKSTVSSDDYIDAAKLKFSSMITANIVDANCVTFIHDQDGFLDVDNSREATLNNYVDYLTELEMCDHKNSLEEIVLQYKCQQPKYIMIITTDYECVYDGPNQTMESLYKINVADLNDTTVLEIETLCLNIRNLYRSITNRIKRYALENQVIKDLEPLVEIIEEPLVEIIEEPLVEITYEPLLEIIEEPLVEILEEPLVEILEEPLVELIEEPFVEILEEPLVETTDEPLMEITGDKSINNETQKDIVEESCDGKIKNTVNSLLDFYGGYIERGWISYEEYNKFSDKIEELEMNKDENKLMENFYEEISNLPHLPDFDNEFLPFITNNSIPDINLAEYIQCCQYIKVGWSYEFIKDNLRFSTWVKNLPSYNRKIKNILSSGQLNQSSNFLSE